jgi:hypothetical protein
LGDIAKKPNASEVNFGLSECFLNKKKGKKTFGPVRMFQQKIKDRKTVRTCPNVSGKKKEAAWSGWEAFQVAWSGS